MSADLTKILGPTRMSKLTHRHPRGGGQFNNILNCTEVLMQAHCDLLSLVWRNLPYHAQAEAEDALLGVGEAAQEVKKAVRMALRQGGQI